MIKKKLKGGSLSGTYLVTTSHGAKFIRKEASLTKNREFGLQRLYSQLKRLQRYNLLFPNLFPEVIEYGMIRERMYFDLEYIPNSMTLHDFLIHETNHEVIDVAFDSLIKATNRLHDDRIPSTWKPIQLYVREEMEQRMDACMVNRRFRDFVAHETVMFNGVECQGIAGELDHFLKDITEAYKGARLDETFSHGNLTLENILIQPKTGRIIFIDLYEENIIDSEVADYSQILQSSNSHYELYNAATPWILGNRVEVGIPHYTGLDHFNTRFIRFLNSKYNEQIRIVHLFEVSQFVRLLPFKMEINEDMMIFFYAYASRLYHELRNE
jgi:hypothetical protein